MTVIKSLEYVTVGVIGIGSVTVFPVLGLIGTFIGKAALVYHNTMIKFYETKLKKKEESEGFRTTFQLKIEASVKMKKSCESKIEWCALNIIPGYALYWALKTVEGREFVNYTPKFILSFFESEDTLKKPSS